MPYKICIIKRNTYHSNGERLSDRLLECWQMNWEIWVVAVVVDYRWIVAVVVAVVVDHRWIVAVVVAVVVGFATTRRADTDRIVFVVCRIVNCDTTPHTY